MEQQQPQIEHQPVESSSIKSVGFDAAERILEIQFKRGGRYRFTGVDVPTYVALMSAKSIGQHFHQHIKPAFKGTPVGGP